MRLTGRKHRGLALVGATLSVVAAALAVAGGASASIKITGDARTASLRVDATGAAEVSWVTAAGDRRSLLVLPSGSLVYGGRLSGADVSRPASDVRIPFAVAVRKTPDGALWALQSWRRLIRGPVELRFARWSGEPTRLTLRAVCCRWGGENIKGDASFQGRPIYGHRATPQGDPLDDLGRNVYLDSYQRGQWVRMMGILTNRPTGYFSLWIRTNWYGTRYRGAIIGPNWGWTLGPDAAAEALSTGLHLSGKAVAAGASGGYGSTRRR